METSNISSFKARAPHSDKYPDDHIRMSDDQVQKAYDEDFLLCSSCNRFFPVVGPDQLSFTNFIDPDPSTPGKAAWIQHVADGCSPPVGWIEIPTEDADRIEEVTLGWAKARTEALNNLAKIFADQIGTRVVEGGTVTRIGQNRTYSSDLQ